MENGMQSLTRTWFMIACLCMGAAHGACAKEDQGQKDVPQDPVGNDMDMGWDETLPLDVADIGFDIDVAPEPEPDAADFYEDGGCTVGVTGDPCSSASQCNCVPSSARECLNTLSGYISFPGGYCSARCTSSADCGTGSNCAEITTGTRYCLKMCTGPSQCRMAEGYVCATIAMSSDTRTYCMPNLDGESSGG